jgi:hypothetical protein
VARGRRDPFYVDAVMKPSSDIMATVRSFGLRRRIYWSGSIADLVQETIVSPRFYALVFWCLAALAWACALTLAAGLLAVLEPARLASRMNPVDLLRAE